MIGCGVTPRASASAWSAIWTRCSPCQRRPMIRVIAGPRAHWIAVHHVSQRQRGQRCHARVGLEALKKRAVEQGEGFGLKIDAGQHKLRRAARRPDEQVEIVRRTGGAEPTRSM